MKSQSDSKINHLIFKAQDHVRIAIITWNLLGSIPPSEQILKLMKSSTFNPKPDIICFSTQECQRSLCMAFFCEGKAQWEDTLIQILNPQYQMHSSITMQGLHTAILIKKSLASSVILENKSYLKAGLMNSIGNKGAVSLQINFLGQNIQFINCHLASDHNETQKRNSTLLRILDEMVVKDLRTEVFISGDMNYRIDITSQEYQTLIRKYQQNTEQNLNYQSMVQKDQLKLQTSLQKSFMGRFIEGKINFPPTYKMSITNEQYSSNRIPGWTDRIFVRAGRTQFIHYGCEYLVRGSDHRPVIGSFFIPIEQGLSVCQQQLIGVSTRSYCNLI